MQTDGIKHSEQLGSGRSNTAGINSRRRRFRSMPGEEGCKDTASVIG